MTERLRRCTELSVTELAEHHRRGFEGYLFPVPADPVAMADRLRVEHIDLHASFELWDDDDVVAFALVARRGRRSRVASMGVPVEARRRGWARRALRRAVAEATERGDEDLRLEVIVQNEGAAALYRDEGFVVARELVGFDGDATAVAAAAPPARLTEISIREAADVVARHAVDLPWQLDAPSLMGLGSASRAWTDGACVAVTRQRDDVLSLQTLLTPPADRRRGHGRAVLAALAGMPGVASVRMLSLVPAGLADGFMAACGFTPAALQQWEMVHPLDGAPA